MQTDQIPVAPGTIVWHQYVASDVHRTIDFYTKVFEWDFVWRKPQGTEELAGHFVSGEHYVCAFAEGEMRRHDLREDPKRAFWWVYVYVKGIKRAMRWARWLGGITDKKKPLVMDGMRTAVVVDLFGGIWRLAETDDDLVFPRHRQAKFFTWCQVPAQDPYRMMRYYQSVFRWELLADFDLDVEGNRFLVFGKDSTAFGAVHHVSGPDLNHSRHCVGVKDVDAVLQRVLEAGGRITAGPMDLPNGDRFAECIDTQDGCFGLHQKAPDGAPRAGRRLIPEGDDLTPYYSPDSPLFGLYSKIGKMRSSWKRLH